METLNKTINIIITCLKIINMAICLTISINSQCISNIINQIIKFRISFLMKELVTRINKFFSQIMEYWKMNKVSNKKHRNCSCSNNSSNNSSSNKWHCKAKLLLMWIKLWQTNNWLHNKIKKLNQAKMCKWINRRRMHLKNRFGKRKRKLSQNWLHNS